MEKIIFKLRKFIEVDLWRLRLGTLPKRERYFFSFIRVCIISVKEFIKNKCAEKASALTYLSMLSLVPVIAMLFIIAKAFGIQELMDRELNIYFSGQTEILIQIRPFINKILDSQGEGIVAGISAIFLIYTVIQLLINIERAFNDMWGIKKSRKWERKISDYVAIILLGPIFLIIASSISIFVKDTIQDMVSHWDTMIQLKSGIIFLLTFLPYTILWILLFGLYFILPNIQVKFKSALFAGIIAGTLYQVNQQVFISMQFAFARYNAIYGSIAFLPLFLIWLQISWLIVLFGFEVCYAFQYINQWEMSVEKLKVSYDYRRKLTILILYRIIKKFEKGNGAISINNLGKIINVPIRYINDICFKLEKSGLINRLDTKEKSYQPSFDIHKMDLGMVINKIENEGMGEFDSKQSTAFKNIEISLTKIEDIWKKDNKLNVLIKDL